MTRTTVFDTAWEMDLLMACLEWPDDQPTLEALQIVKPEWFLVGLNRALWEIFIAVAEETGGVDAAAIFTKIRKDPRFSEADRMLLTDTLFSSFHRSSAGSAQTPMLALREAHTRRTLGKLAGKIGALAADFVAPMSELEALALQAGDVVMNAADRADMEEGTLADCIDRYLIGEPLLDPHRSRNLAVFGIDTLDRELVAGPGSLGVLAAKTSAGKTSLAVQVLLRFLCGEFDFLIAVVAVGLRLLAGFAVVGDLDQPGVMDDEVGADSEFHVLLLWVFGRAGRFLAPRTSVGGWVRSRWSAHPT